MNQAIFRETAILKTDRIIVERKEDSSNGFVGRRDIVPVQICRQHRT